MSFLDQWALLELSTNLEILQTRNIRHHIFQLKDLVLYTQMTFKVVTNISLLLPHIPSSNLFLLCFPPFLLSPSPLPLPNAPAMPMATTGVLMC